MLIPSNFKFLWDKCSFPGCGNQLVMFIPVDDTIVGCGLCKDHAPQATEFMSIGFFYVYDKDNFAIISSRKGPILVDIKRKTYSYITELHKIKEPDYLLLDLISISEPKGHHTNLYACISPLVDMEVD